MNLIPTKLKILIVEDEQAIVDAISEAITSFKEFQIIGVTDSESIAFEICKSEMPDIIIADVDLKEGCGISLMKLIKSDRFFENQTPFLFAMTSYSSPTVSQQLKLYADNIFYKNIPFSAQNLLTILSFKMLDILQLRKQVEKIPLGHENQVKTIIQDTLNKYQFKPRTNHQRTYLSSMIYLIITTPEGEREPNLKTLRTHVANTFKLKNEKSLNIMLDRYIKDIYDLTPPEVLVEIGDPFSAKHKPSVFHFIDHIATVVKNKI